MKVSKKTDLNPSFQGDIMIRRLTAKELPEGATKMTTNVVAHSETGHHHTVTGADIYAMGELDMVLRATSKRVTFKHHRPYDTHETLVYDVDIGDLISVNRQQEYTPQGLRKVED